MGTINAVSCDGSEAITSVTCDHEWTIASLSCAAFVPGILWGETFGGIGPFSFSDIGGGSMASSLFQADGGDGGGIPSGGFGGGSDGTRPQEQPPSGGVGTGGTDSPYQPINIPGGGFIGGGDDVVGPVDPGSIPTGGGVGGADQGVFITGE